MISWRKKLETLLGAWVDLVLRFRYLVLVLGCVTVILAAYYAMHNLGMNTSTRDMLSPELPWRKADLAIDEKFPQFSNNITVVVEAPTPDQAADAATLLQQHLVTETEFFQSVYYPSGLEFFKRSALLYLDPGELQDLADDLAAIQPFLSRLTEDHSVRGLFAMLNQALEAKLEGEDIDLSPLLTRINRAFAAREQKQPYTLSWQALMGGGSEDQPVYREFIVLHPVANYGSIFPYARAMDRLHALVAGPGLINDPGVRVRLTGSAALSHEEMLNVSRGATNSSIAAFILVTLILLIGLRSLRLTIASLMVLVAGLIYTAWFAAFTVGELNLISVAFTVLYIGLGADFAIHFCLRYRELLEQGQASRAALHTTATDTGMALILCMGTTALGFYAFIPTDYDGVAELGLISGTGMLISFLVTLTLLPALLAVLPARRLKALSTSDNLARAALRTFPVRHARTIRRVTVVVTLAALVLASHLKFDHNTLNLQSRKNESVQTFLDLLADSDVTPWTGTTLAQGAADARTLAARLEQVPVVKKVVWLDDFIPDRQEEKLSIIADMDLLLTGTAGTVQKPAPADSEQILELTRFRQLLASAIHSGEAGNAYQTLHDHLGRYLDDAAGLDDRSRYESIARLQHSLLASFPARFAALMQSLQAEEVSAATLPEEIRERWVNHNTYRLEIQPLDNLLDNEMLRRFVREIQDVVPAVSGTPVISVEAGSAVVKAFQQAFLYAFLATSLLLLLLTHRAMDVVLIMTPLLLAALFAGSIGVLAGMNLNFANIIALPLLLAIGMDSGIIMLQRARKLARIDDSLLASSSARAIVLSALTTICSIGNLAFSPHPGTASMGMLLTIGLIMTLICTLIILPSLLAGKLPQEKSRD